MNPALTIWASAFAGRGGWPRRHGNSWRDGLHPVSYTRQRYRSRDHT